MVKTVVVGMSGGVDSSVAAYLLQKKGYKVIGLFMKNWEEDHESCTAAEDYQDVVQVATHLKIPFYAVNFAKEYRERVFADFLAESKKGVTPNPDILCNREIKFSVLFDKALELGADYLATGHYARTSSGLLYKGLDPAKDQSYFLYTLRKPLLEKVLFPIGELIKGDVRAIAKEAGLATYQKKDSTGLCFIGERNFREFLSHHLAFKPGPLVDDKGKKVGEHVGYPFYTIGQRKGLNIGGPGEAWFVVDKDPASNTVIVAQGENHPRLFHSSLVASTLSWVEDPPSAPFEARAKVRYRQSDQECLVEKIESGQAYVTFKQPQRAITPGQSIVLYHEDKCLGGGIIQSRK
jgi:tRNA-specific 2-thiouridylase